jgi:hypothetical protein
MLKNSFKTMVLKSLVLVGFLSVTGLAQSAQDIWIEGLGQGNLEYFITNQTAQLHISCSTTSSLPETKSNVALIIDGKQAPKFELIVGFYSFDVPFDANSRLGSDNFKILMTELKKYDAIVKFRDTTIVFPKSNAANVFPQVNSKDFVCKTSF